MRDIYEEFHIFKNDNFLIREILNKDATDLLKVYSDKEAVKFFNGDNCDGDDFYYATMEEVNKAINFWQFSYKERYFVRWSIEDVKTGHVIGTIEMFHRDSAKDIYDNTGLLRLDLRSDYEKEEVIKEIISLIMDDCYDLFYCKYIATKGFKNATARRAALKALGFADKNAPLVGNDGTEYYDYFIKEK